MQFLAMTLILRNRTQAEVSSIPHSCHHTGYSSQAVPVEEEEAQWYDEWGQFVATS